MSPHPYRTAWQPPRAPREYFAPLLAVFALALGVACCTPSAIQVQARAADVVGRAANAALPALVAQYQLDGDQALDSAGNDLAARAAALDAVRVRWRRVWPAWRALTAAQGAYADALERARADRSLTPADVLRLAGQLDVAYCSLRAALPAPVVLPDIPLLPCPEVRQ